VRPLDRKADVDELVGSAGNLGAEHVGREIPWLRRGVEGYRAEEGLAVDIDAGTRDVAAALLPVVRGDELGDEVRSGESGSVLEPSDVEEAEVAEGGLEVGGVGPAQVIGWRPVDVVLDGAALGRRRCRWGFLGGGGGGGARFVRDLGGVLLVTPAVTGEALGGRHSR
jgi:hypothetical protein